MASSGDVTVFCDPTLKPAMLALSGLGGFAIYPLCAPGPLMVAQIIRHTRNDVLFTLDTVMDDAVAAKLVVPASRQGGFTNNLVLAGLQGRFSSALDQTGLQTLLAKASLAVTDDTSACNLDGRAILAANNLSASMVQGAANTGDVSDMVTTRAVDIGLMYLTDVQADPRLAVLATLTAPPAVTSYAAAVNASAFSANAQALVNLLHTPNAIARLSAAGVKVST
ncbi:MAG TPA: substrate-binding domain-containing protein [Acidocella sp.]|nr:substrate-binding domain-containing protein [Acidocella sp.]